MEPSPVHCCVECANVAGLIFFAHKKTASALFSSLRKKRLTSSVNLPSNNRSLSPVRDQSSGCASTESSVETKKSEQYLKT